MANPYDEPTEECPYCKTEMSADWVDVGVGSVQCGPYHCTACGASEIGPELDDWCYKDRDGYTIRLLDKRRYVPAIKRKVQWRSKTVLKPNHPFSDKELEIGFYEPKTKKVSPYANTLNGELVNHIDAKALYNIGLLDEKDI